MKGYPARVLAFLAATALLASSAAAQDPAAAVPPADPEDVATPDAIIAALYDVISGPAGAARDWDRMRSLFVPGARLIPTGVRPDGTRAHRIMSVEDYIRTSGPVLERDGFFETETHRVTERFGNILHAFSTYDSRRNADDAEPFMRGINSIQLFHDGARWWVVTVFWDSERPDNPIPANYLP
ncbi:MAG TPA: hypothetical protein VFU06_15735 [Longimicrobiales bacterium]|nr:hypothetical protein [Longimicrobiales bacterium]